VEAFERGGFDVILMDIQMPEMDGLGATAEIRNRETRKRRPSGPDPEQRIPIVALTAHAMAGDRERFLEAGMDGYVSKPIQVTELLAMISGVCGHSDRSTRPTES